jgi:hypothetical protein
MRIPNPNDSAQSMLAMKNHHHGSDLQKEAMMILHHNARGHQSLREFQRENHHYLKVMIPQRHHHGNDR